MIKDGFFMIHTIYFSFNRAMQLDTSLRYFLKNVLAPIDRISVIFRATRDHKLGYDLLKQKYKNVMFFEEENNINFFSDTLPHLTRPRNLYRFLKYPFLRKNKSNFKQLLEKVIKETNSDFVMFSTDDSLFFREASFGDEVFSKIRANPTQVSYRLYVGSNHSDAPKGLKTEGELLSWNYFDKEMYRHWAYPFAIDGTIYDTKSLKNIILPILYHNPSTFEAYICRECIVRKFFSFGLSPLKSSMVGVPINKVQGIYQNKHGNIDVEILNRYFLMGFTLDYELPSPIAQNAVDPRKITLTRNNEIIDLLQ